MAYHGNLALLPERRPQETRQPARQMEKEKVVRRRHLPVWEKLLYLLTVFVFVFVAGLIIYRYAEIYQMNRQIQDTNRQVEKMKGDIKDRERQVELLSDRGRITAEALKRGLVPIDQNKGIIVGDQSHAVAMNIKK